MLRTITTAINKKVEGLPKDIQARMDGLDDLVGLYIAVAQIIK